MPCVCKRILARFLRISPNLAPRICSDEPPGFDWHDTHAQLDASAWVSSRKRTLADRLFDYKPVPDFHLLAPALDFWWCS